MPNRLEKPAVTSPEGTPTHEIRFREKLHAAFWSVSQPIAGRYSNLDLIFTADEEYIFIGLETAVHVYSVSTSRLFRTLEVESNHKVVGYRLCPVNEEHLYVFTSGGIGKWEWATGKRMTYWNMSCKKIAIDLTSDGTEDSMRTISYIVREHKDGKRQISAMCLADQRPLETIILDSTRRITNLKVARRGQIIVAWDNHHLLVGNAKVDIPISPVSGQYTWREVNLPVNITCLDLRLGTHPVNTEVTGSKSRRHLDTVDLVLGESGGSILVLYDAVNSLTNNEVNYQGRQNSSFKRLHWHRGPVHAVRWSKDGNYILSGGDESVMVLWQLDTARKQYLPHLPSPICNIVVSPTGNSYAVKLADNSIMILSARELRAHTTITGLQLCPTPTNQLVGQGQYTGGTYHYFRAAASLHPKQPDQLLIAVPASQQISGDAHICVNSPVLQTYNIRTNSHISRQALTRTNATTLTMSPEGSKITTPDIEYLSVAHDGKWLATVDSWRPSKDDLKACELSHIATDDNGEDYQEIFLKFWKWNSLSSLWELVTRVDNPHFLGKSTLPVLDLTSQPHNHGFASIGADAVLRFWYPSPRQRSGLKAVNVEQQLETWKCRNIVDLKGSIGNINANRLCAACMCFSGDGSVLGVSLQSESSNHNITLLIDIYTHEICHSRVGIFSGDLCAIKFIGRHLIIASSRSLSAWDTVGDTVRTIGPPDLAKHKSTEGSPRLLAVDPNALTFAVTTHYNGENSSGRPNKKRRKVNFYVQIYDLGSLTLLYELPLRTCPLALLLDPVSGDYIIVDAVANVRRLGSLGNTTRVTAGSHDASSHLKSGLANLFRSHAGHSNLKLPARAVAVEAEDASLSTKALANVFGDAASFSLPSVGALFKDVVKYLRSG